jgi:hypothetical protein
MTGWHGMSKLTRGLGILTAVLSFSSLAAQARTPIPGETYRGPGRYEIAVVASGKLLSLDERSQHTVFQWSALHSNNQRWDIEDAGDGFVYIRSAVNGMALDIEGDYARDGSPAIVSRPGRGDSQLWRIIVVDDGRVNFVSRLGLALSLPKGSDENGAQMQVRTLRDAGIHEDQKFRLTWISAPVAVPFGNRYEGHDRDARDEKNWYDLGYSAGVQDFTAHLNRSYARHRSEYSPHGEAAFIEGYYDGYDAGRIDRGRMHDEERDSYDAGYRLGQQDQREGRKPNYMRYSDRFNERSEADFRRGYEDGYYSTR